MAREKAPAIIFIDEIDAIAAKRIEIGTSGEREVQRTFMQMLAEIDGFDALCDVKIVGCTNRLDILDPAITRPGRLDRKIEFPQPDRRQKRMVFQAATSKMNLGDELDMEDYVSRSEKISCADVSAICAEAGLQAVRENRYVVLGKDFDSAYKKVVSNREKEHLFYSI
jgi:26S proteasome regulatory subunit T3